METVTAGTVFQPWNWPKDTWFQNRREALKLGIDVSVGEGEVTIERNGDDEQLDKFCADD